MRSHPLAGTAPRSGDPAVDARIASALVASTKDQLEHRLTIDMVHDTLLPWCSYLDEEAEPSIVAVANVQHLGTLVEGPVEAAAFGARPRALPDSRGRGCAHRALEMIDELERLDRARYAGPVGWMGAGATAGGQSRCGVRTATVWRHRVGVVRGPMSLRARGRRRNSRSCSARSFVPDINRESIGRSIATASIVTPSGIVRIACSPHETNDGGARPRASP